MVEPKKWNRWITCAAAAGMALVLYFFSAIGTAILYEKGIIQQGSAIFNALQVIHAPMVAIADANPAVEAVLDGCVAFFVQVPASSVQLVITGPEGQRFTGAYVADDTTNRLSGVVPVTVTLHAKALRYEFTPEDGREEFRVEFSVEDKLSTSFCSYKGEAVSGAWSRRTRFR